MTKLYGIWDGAAHVLELNGRQVLGRPTSKSTPDLSIPFPTVSRTHGEFITDQDGCRYRDLGSSNGTFLNGRQLPPNKFRAVEEGDILSIHGINDPDHRFDIRLRLIADRPVKDRVLSIHIAEKTVQYRFQKLTLLRDISLEIRDRSMALVLGGSGAGKTTFMNAVMGYEQAKGEIFYDNINIYTQYEKMKRQIGYVPQQDLLRMNDTVYDTLMGAARMRLSFSLSDDGFRRRVLDTMQMLGLEREQNSLVGKLSGGQRKRLSIAVEYIGDPSLFFLDEPDSGLDGTMARELMENLRKIADDHKIVMVISHNPDRAFDLFDQVIVLAKSDKDNCGHLVYTGMPRDACEFFGVRTLEGIVRKINRPDEGGEGMAEYFIQKYTETEKRR